MINILICTSDQGYHSGIRELFSTPVERNLSLKKIAAMSYYEDDYDEQYEEYCRQYEEIIYVDGGLTKNEYDEEYWKSYG